MRNLKFIRLFAAASSMLLLTSCLKDKKIEEEAAYGTWNVTGRQIVELPAPTPNGTNIVNLDFANTDTTFNVVAVNLAADQPAQEDVIVTLRLNPTLVADYNTANGTAYVAPPSSVFTMDPLTVTIPRGSRFGYLKMRAKPSDLATGAFAFGFSIASVSDPKYTISSNFRNTVVIVGVKNRYDGVYSLKFKMVDWTAYSIAVGPYDWGGNVHMITAGTNSVKLFDAWGFGTYIHPAVNTTPAYTGFGQTQPKFIFDLNTNKLIDCVNDQVTTNGRTFTINPAVTTSRWDPATKNIYAAIILKQTGRPDLMIYDTLTYVGPR
jgi:hypothetical protein